VNFSKIITFLNLTLNLTLTLTLTLALSCKPVGQDAQLQSSNSSASLSDPKIISTVKLQQKVVAYTELELRKIIDGLESSPKTKEHFTSISRFILAGIQNVSPMVLRKNCFYSAANREASGEFVTEYCQEISDFGQTLEDHLREFSIYQDGRFFEGIQKAFERENETFEVSSADFGDQNFRKKIGRRISDRIQMNPNIGVQIAKETQLLRQQDYRRIFNEIYEAAILSYYVAYWKQQSTFLDSIDCSISSRSIKIFPPKLKSQIRQVCVQMQEAFIKEGRAKVLAKSSVNRMTFQSAANSLNRILLAQNAKFNSLIGVVYSGSGQCKIPYISHVAALVEDFNRNSVKDLVLDQLPSFILTNDNLKNKIDLNGRILVRNTTQMTRRGQRPTASGWRYETKPFQLQCLDNRSAPDPLMSSTDCPSGNIGGSSSVSAQEISDAFHESLQRLQSRIDDLTDLYANHHKMTVSLLSNVTKDRASLLAGKLRSSLARLMIEEPMATGGIIARKVEYLGLMKSLLKGRVVTEVGSESLAKAIKTSLTVAFVASAAFSLPVLVGAAGLSNLAGGFGLAMIEAGGIISMGKVGYYAASYHSASVKAELFATQSLLSNRRQNQELYFESLSDASYKASKAMKGVFFAGLGVVPYIAYLEKVKLLSGITMLAAKINSSIRQELLMLAKLKTLFKSKNELPAFQAAMKIAVARASSLKGVSGGHSGSLFKHFQHVIHENKIVKSSEFVHIVEGLYGVAPVGFYLLTPGTGKFGPDEYSNRYVDDLPRGCAFDLVD